VSDAAYDGLEAGKRRLIEDVAALESLADHPGWAVYVRLAHEALDDQQLRLISGKIEDVSEYKLVAGRVQALHDMLAIPEQARERFDRAMAADGERYSDEWVESPVAEPRGRAEYAPGDGSPDGEVSDG
jgi:hypothetical protein